MGWIDYWCNAFTPDRKAVWEKSIAQQGIPLKIHREGDGFADPKEMKARMDELGVETLVIPTCPPSEHHGDTDFESVATTPEELELWNRAAPGAFAGAWSFDPGSGMAGVREAARHLPKEIPAILALGRAHGCDYVLLDCDGPTESALPTFPW